MQVMETKPRVKIKAVSFGLLVKQLKLRGEEADVFEVDIDFMRVKGDLAVIATYFKEKKLVGVTHSLDLAKRVAKSSWYAIKVPAEFKEDMELRNLLKNKGVELELI
ncbi:MAG: hypothetical protein ACI9QC_000462 [Oceanicoccus sp.]|jgi:hypothetical protein